MRLVGDGRRISVADDLPPDGDGNIIGASKIARDITDVSAPGALRQSEESSRSAGRDHAPARAEHAASRPPAWPRPSDVLDNAIPLLSLS